MKKLLVFVLMISLWTLGCGFTEVKTGTILYSAGQVREYVVFNYDETTAEAMNKSSIEELEVTLETIKNQTAVYLINIVKNEIQNLETNYSKSQLEIYFNNNINGFVSNGEFCIYINYPSTEIWNLFCQDTITTSSTTTTKDLFTKTVKTEMQMNMARFDYGISNRGYTYDVVKARVSTALGIYASVMPSSFSYSYLTSSSRLHSDADVVTYDTSSNLYYHTWNFDNSNNTIMTIWRTSANTLVWYLFAIGLTAVFVVVLVVVAKAKKQKSK